MKHNVRFLGLLVQYGPPLSKSWIITIIWLYIALNGTLVLGGGSTQPKPQALDPKP